MKKIIVLLSALLSITVVAQQKSFHDFTVYSLEGEKIELSSFKGKKVLVVNTASKCGLTPQYAKLQELYEKYGGSNFEIIGFPANNFKEQEPGTNKEIREFCTKNYGVSFIMAEKISVKGDDIHPLYQWLTKKEENGLMDSEVKWNFQKYLIDENGKLVDVIYPMKSPKSDEIINWIEGK